MKKPAEAVTLRSEEGEALIVRVHQNTLSPVDASLVERIIRTHVWLVLALHESKITVKRLRSLLFGKRLTPSPAPADSSAPTPAGGEETHACAVVEADVGDANATAEETPPHASQTPERVKPTGGHRPGTGRLSADASVGAERMECRHEELSVGQRCPVCGQGTLYELPPGRQMRIDGHALLRALRYALPKLRGSACGETLTAGLPAGVREEKDSPRARAVLAGSRCYPGVPGYRLQGYQAMRGLPGPDATQWEQIEVVCDCASKVCEQMESEAAQGDIIFQDDTAVRIVSLLKENRDLLAAARARGLSRPTERTGMHTTALAVHVGEHTAMLYDSSRRHAGENLQGLLDKRQAGLAKPLVMSDALVSNSALIR